MLAAKSRRIDRRRAARASAPAPPARQAGAAGARAAPGQTRRPPRRSSTRWRWGGSTTTSPRPAALAGRGVPPGDLELPARVGDGAAHGSAHRPHRRRGVVGQGLRAEGGLRALRGPARLLPGRVRAGARAAREGGSRREAPADGPSGRAGPERPLERRDRGGCRRPGRLRGAASSTSSSSAPGPAGLSAAVYGASEGLRTLVVDEGGIGGQARSSSLIRNYLGFPRGVSGSRLAEQAYEQASVFGASFVFMHRATALGRSGDRLTVSLADGRRLSAAAVILATGASYRRLGVPSLEALTGAGVFYGGPASEAHALSGKDVYIAGGGNSAGQAALAPCALRAPRHARRARRIARGRDVALPGAGGRGDAERRGAHRHRGGRRGRRRPAAGAGAARDRHRRRERRSPPTRSSC